MKSALVFLILAVAVTAFAAPKTVCTVTINSSNEREAFMRNLQPQGFKFVELTEFDKTSKASNRNESQWLKNACDSGVQCDVLLISAHFGGFYFGSSGYQITVPTLETQSCNNTCDGILKRPREVFIAGCNALADKGKDSRTQQQYIDVLIADGFRPDMATQVAETRYGAAGSTFRDQTRRVFAGIPHIYGYGTASPRGSVIGRQFDNYFKAVGDYSAHLEEMSRSLAPNDKLSAATVGNVMLQTTGVGTSPGDAGVPYRKLICDVYDNKASIAERTAVIVKMLKSADRFIFLNSVVSFLNMNITAIQADYWANDALNKVVRDDETMKSIDDMKSKPTTSLSLRLDLMDLEVKLGRMSRQDFVTQSTAVLKPLVRNLSQANADLVCSAMHAHNLKMNVTLEDFAPGVLTKAASLYAMQCLQTSDERITQTIIPMINQPEIRRDGNSIRAYLLALIRLPGANENKVKAAQMINNFTSSFGPYSYGVMTVATTGQDQLNAAATLASLDVNNISLSYELMQYVPRNEGLGVSLLGALPRAQTKQSRRVQMTALIRTLPIESAYWTNVAKEIQNSDEMSQAIFMGVVAQASKIPTAMSDLATYLMTTNSNFPTYFGAVLGKADLTRDQQVNLINIANQNPNAGKSGLIRWALSVQKSPAQEIRKYVKGPAIKPICEVVGDVLQCRFEKAWIR